MFKNIILAILFDLILIPSFEMTTSFADVNLCTRKDVRSSEIGSLQEKLFLVLNELKTSLMSKFSLQNSLQSLKVYGVRGYRYMLI